MTKFSDWLDGKFTEWKAEQREKKRTISEYSIHLGISQPNLSRYLKGRTVPESDNLRRLVARYGNEVYAALDTLPSVTDERLRIIVLSWETLSEKTRDHLASTVAQLERKKK